MPRIPTSAISGLSLVLGFATAEVAPSRGVGGVVLVAGLVWCLAREIRRTPWWAMVAVVAVAALTFAASHRVAGVLGAWPSVLLAAAVTAAAAWWFVDRPGRARDERMPAASSGTPREVTA